MLIDWHTPMTVVGRWEQCCGPCSLCSQSCETCLGGTVVAGICCSVRHRLLGLTCLLPASDGPLRVDSPRSQSQSQGRKQPVLRWNAPNGLDPCRPTFRRFFGADLAVDVHSWISGIRDPAQPLRWILFLHLYISFQHQVGQLGDFETPGSLVCRQRRLGTAGEPHPLECATQALQAHVSAIPPRCQGALCD